MLIFISLIGVARGAALYSGAVISATTLMNYELHDPAGYTPVSKVSLPLETSLPGSTELFSTSASLPPTSANYLLLPLEHLSQQHPKPQAYIRPLSTP